MTWSMRMAPACRSTVRSMSRYGLYAGARQGVGAPRRLRPVLPLLVVHVRRRTDRGAAGEHVAERPHVGALRVHADGEVVHDARAPCRRRARRAGPSASCSSATHCSHRWNSTRSASSVAERRRRAPTTGRAPRRATALTSAYFSASAHQSANVSSPAPSCSTNASNAACRAADRGRREDDLERGALGGPGGVAVDRAGVVVGGQHRLGRPLDQRAVRRRQVARLADVLDADVERVHEPAGGRQVRRRRQRDGRLGGVQRVDEQEVGAELAPGEPADLGEVRQVADAPRRAATAPSRAGP